MLNVRKENARGTGEEIGTQEGETESQTGLLDETIPGERKHSPAAGSEKAQETELETGGGSSGPRRGALGDKIDSVGEGVGSLQ